MKSNKYYWISIGILVGVSALAYLPLINKLGYINDDWYLMYDARVHGANFFHEIFSIDRPLRGYIMQAVYSLFGLNPFPYHISAYVLRLLSALGFLWLCTQLWPGWRKWNLFAAVQFLIYPGFLSQINPIDYQSQFISLACAMFSIALTFYAVQEEAIIRKWLFTLLSIFLAWVYLGLVEYFIGLEVLRFTGILVIFIRDTSHNISSRMRRAFYSSLTFILGPGVYLVWRLFFFSAERKATDFSLQISSLFSSPLTILWWLNYLVQDVFKVTFSAWVVPLDFYAFSLRLRDTYMGFAIAALAVILFLFMFWQLDAYLEGDNSDKEEDSRNGKEGLWLALLTIVAGILPIIMVNRHVVFPDYSRYAIASSVGVAILISVMVRHIASQKLKYLIMGILVGIGVLTHYGNAVKAAADTEEVRNFWWQVAWRAPQIEPGTTISVTYPNAAIQEDYFIWGAANHIYYPNPKSKDDLQVQLPGILLNEYTVSRIMVGRGSDMFKKRGDILVVNEYDRVLVMTQATGDSCIRILDGNSPDLSLQDHERVMLVSPYSALDAVRTDDDFHNPPAVIFGNEPLHEWCYFYQKADLARQQGVWEKVVDLYEEAARQDLRPNDQIELMPFLQAYAYMDNQKMVKDFSTRINTEVFYAEQACHKLSMMDELGFPLTPEMQNFVDELFCK